MQRHLPHLYHLIQLTKVRIKGMGGRRGEGVREEKALIFFNPKVVLLLLL